MISQELARKINICKKCPLYNNNPELTNPLSGIGTKNNFIITEKPNFYSMRNESPDGIEYDFIAKIFKDINKEFYYTHMIKCFGKYTSKNLDECKTWISEEIDCIKPNIIFTLGNASKIFTKEKINTLVGQNITYNKYNVVHLYNPNYVLKQGKKEVIYFRQLIIKYAT